MFIIIFIIGAVIGFAITNGNIVGALIGGGVAIAVLVAAGLLLGKKDKKKEIKSMVEIIGKWAAISNKDNYFEFGPLQGTEGLFRANHIPREGRADKGLLRGTFVGTYSLLEGGDKIDIMIPGYENFYLKFKIKENYIEFNDVLSWPLGSYRRL